MRSIARYHAATQKYITVVEADPPRSRSPSGTCTGLMTTSHLRAQVTQIHRRPMRTRKVQSGRTNILPFLAHNHHDRCRSGIQRVPRLLCRGEKVPQLR